MNVEVSFKSFLFAIIFGMGVHIGWGLISLVVWAMARALSVDTSPLLH